MANFNELGQAGLGIWSGIVTEDFLKEMRGADGFRRFNEMRLNSPVVGSLLLAIENAIRGVDWTFSSDLTADEQEDERVDFLNAARDNMSHSWNDHITEALTFLPFGWSLFEICYRRGEETDPEELRDKITWRKLAIRGQDTLDRWELDDNGGLVAFKQRAAPVYKPVTIPIDKCLLYRARVEKGNPEGRSILRTAWIPYYYLKNMQQIEAIGVERDLAGMPLIKLPEGADTTESTGTDFDKARKLVRRMRRDEEDGVVVPYGWEVELLSTGGSRQLDVDAIIRRYESRILMSSLSQFLMLGQDKVGSLALSSDQSDFFNMSVNATADIIAETFTKYAIPRLLKLNGMDPLGVKMEHSLAGDTNLPELADFMQKVGSMLTWTAADEAWLRGAARLPVLDPDEIQAERDLQAEQEFERQQQFMKMRKPDEGEEEGEEEKPTPFGAEVYAAAPQEREREAWERRMYTLARRFLAGQQVRLIRGAKKVKRNA